MSTTRVRTRTEDACRSYARRGVAEAAIKTALPVEPAAETPDSSRARASLPNRIAR